MIVILLWPSFGLTFVPAGRRYRFARNCQDAVAVKGMLSTYIHFDRLT